MRKLIPILVAGHGGMINGVYQTAGKRSPAWSKGVLYEGMFNRWMVNRIIEKLDRAGIPYYHANPELTDVSLSTRKRRINTMYAENKDVYSFEVHANGGGGIGIEGYTTIGITRSDAIGEQFLLAIQTEFPEVRMRFDNSDGDRDKEKNFYLIREVAPPAFLLESGFMDRQADYNNLWDEEYADRMAGAVSRIMIKLYNLGI